MRFRDLKKQSNKNNQTNKNEQNVKYATYVDRIKALITDLFMIYAPILYIITYVVLGDKDSFQNSQLAPLVGVTLYGLIYAVLISKFGQTPGKKAYEIKVVDIRSGNNLSFVKAFYRFILFLISAVSLIGLILPLYRKDNRALHDLICGSVVIAFKTNEN